MTMSGRGGPECMCQTVNLRSAGHGRARRHVGLIAVRRPASMHALRRVAAATGGAAPAVARRSPNPPPPHTKPAPPPNPPTAHTRGPFHLDIPPTAHTRGSLSLGHPPRRTHQGVPSTWGACLDETHSAVAHAVAPTTAARHAARMGCTATASLHCERSGDWEGAASDVIAHCTSACRGLIEQRACTAGPRDARHSAPSFVSFLAKLIVAQLVLACVDVIVMKVRNDGEVGSGACRGAPPR